MGLDQYAYRKIKGEKYKDARAIATWRKHSRLHGWMENLYKELGGVGEFNCVKLRLKKKHLSRLYQDIKNFNLPETKGFFFGPDYTPGEYVEHLMLEDLQFIEDALEAIEEGDKVYYDSWW